MKMTEGLLNAKRPKPPSPKASPEGFVWPSQRDADEKVAQKIAASLQELLTAKGWKHIDLARELYGTFGPNDTPRNPSPCRRWVVAELPIPNEEAAGHIAQLLDVPMSRLLEPKGKFNPTPEMIRPRSDSKRFPSGNKPKKKAKAGAPTRNRDVKKQREYNAAYREKKRAEKEGKVKRKYTRHAKVNGAANPGWKLAAGIDAPDYKITSADCPPGHLKLEVTAVMPHERAMAILHMLQHEGEGQEG
jgi:hypothetical protein